MQKREGKERTGCSLATGTSSTSGLGVLRRGAGAGAGASGALLCHELARWSEDGDWASPSSMEVSEVWWRLTARAASAGSLVLSLSLLTVAVEGRLLAT